MTGYHIHPARKQPHTKKPAIAGLLMGLDREFMNGGLWLSRRASSAYIQNCVSVQANCTVTGL